MLRDQRIALHEKLLEVAAPGSAEAEPTVDALYGA